MNLYFAEVNRDDIDFRTGYREPEMIFDAIYAPTRGKARALFCKRRGTDWTAPIRVLLVERDVDAEQGYVDDNDALNECLYRLYERGALR